MGLGKHAWNQKRVARQFYYLVNREEELAYRKVYQQANKEKIAKRKRVSNKAYRDSMASPYVRQKYRLPKAAPSELVDACRALSVLRKGIRDAKLQRVKG